MLFLGFSLDDDNFHRIIDDVRRLLRDAYPADGTEKMGTVVSITDSPSFMRLWGDDLRITALAQPSETKPFDPEAARRLEIFLDLLVHEAANRHAFILDPDFDGMLNPNELRLVNALTELRNLDQTDFDGTCARPVGELLAYFGAAPGPRGEVLVVQPDGTTTRLAVTETPIVDMVESHVPSPVSAEALPHLDAACWSCASMLSGDENVFASRLRMLGNGTLAPLLHGPVVFTGPTDDHGTPRALDLDRIDELIMLVKQTPSEL